MSIFPFGHFLFAGITLLPVVVLWLIPVGIGVFWVRGDANRLSQPGWLWALLTIPLSWVAIVTYLVVRALLPGRAQA